MTYKCLLCGRDKFTHPSPHNCKGGYRKRGLKFQPIKQQTMKAIRAIQYLEDLGFNKGITYDKDFSKDEFYSLKIVCYTKVINGLSIEITESHKFNKDNYNDWELNDLMTEICICGQGVEIPTPDNIDKLKELLTALGDTTL